MSTSTSTYIDDAEKALEVILTLAGVGAIGIPVAKILQAGVHAMLDKQGIPTTDAVTAKSAAIDKLFTDSYARADAELKAKFPNG